MEECFGRLILHCRDLIAPLLVHEQEHLISLIIARNRSVDQHLPDIRVRALQRSRHVVLRGIFVAGENGEDDLLVGQLALHLRHQLRWIMQPVLDLLRLNPRHAIRLHVAVGSVVIMSVRHQLVVRLHRRLQMTVNHLAQVGILTLLCVKGEVIDHIYFLI